MKETFSLKRLNILCPKASLSFSDVPYYNSHSWQPTFIRSQDRKQWHFIYNITRFAQNMQTYSTTYNHLPRTINAVTLQPTTRRWTTSYPSFHLGGHFGLLEWMHNKLTIAPNIITPNSHYTTSLHDILFCNCSESETTEVTYYLLSRNGRIRDGISSQQLHKNLMTVPPSLSPQYN